MVESPTIASAASGPSTSTMTAAETAGTSKETAFEIPSDSAEEGEIENEEAEMDVEPSTFPADPVANLSAPQRFITLEEQLRPILAEPDPIESDSDIETVAAYQTPFSKKLSKKKKKSTLKKPWLSKPAPRNSPSKWNAIANTMIASKAK
jgi:hypothetical protein